MSRQEAALCKELNKIAGTVEETLRTRPMSSKRSHRDIIPVSHGNRPHLPNLPPRKGRRPMTLRATLHLQCDGHGPQIYLERLVKEVSSWPGVESLPSLVAPLQWHAMWTEEALASPEPSALSTVMNSPTFYSGVPRQSMWRSRYRALTGQLSADGRSRIF